MARASTAWDDAQERGRGERFYALREQLGLTVDAMADELNTVAATLGLPERWTGEKVAKIGKGKQNLTLEDTFCVAAYDPEQRNMFWWAYGRREQPAVKRAGGSGKHPPPKPVDASLYQPVPRPAKRRRSG